MFTRAVAVCGGLGNGAGERAPADLGRALVELLLLVRKLNLLADRERTEKGGWGGVGYNSIRILQM